MIDGLAWLILAFPLMALGVQIVFGKQLPRQGDFVSTGAMGMSLLCGLMLFFVVVVWQHDPGFIYPPQPSALSWFSGGNLQFSFGFHIDALTAVMVLVVGVVSFLVHVYSMGYMQGEAFYDRYFAYLSLFSFSMLLLVLCDNLLVLYISWELVGVSSYLLIGFYFWRPAAADACKKAFITTRVGDVFMLIGLLLVVLHTGKFNYREVFDAVAQGQFSGTVLTVAAICLFGGAVGKSAQFPLHVWLPDAMEGPTPVSALIHAATMVNAGVYLLARFYPAFAQVPGWTLAVTLVGLVSALIAAFMALAATDLKRALAYSTVSQLGYMVYAIGVGGVLASQFHLLSHAVFKALLFLAAGAVIHASGTRDMRRMGALGKQMPFVRNVFVFGALALMGIPILNGFWSKEMILEAGLSHGPIWALVGMVMVAGMTAFYTLRMTWLVFFGEARESRHAHEAGRAMKVSLGLLGLGAWTTWLLIEPFSALLQHTLPFHGISSLNLSELSHEIFAAPLTYAALIVIALGLGIFWMVRKQAAGRRESWMDVLSRESFGFEWLNRRVASWTVGLGSVLQRTQTGVLSWNAVGILGALLIVLVFLVWSVK